MKSMHIITGLAIALSVTACADKADTPPPPPPGLSAQTAQPVISGAVYLKQRMAIPSGAVLTVTLSDAAGGSGPTRVIAQKVQRLSGQQQSPLHYELAFNGADVNSRTQTLLSAAITLDGKVIYAADSLQPITAGASQRQDLTLIPFPQVAVPVVAVPAVVTPDGGVAPAVPAAPAAAVAP